MSDFNDFAPTQVLYLFAGHDSVVRKDRYIRIIRILSIRNIFEVETVEAVDKRENHPGVMVYPMDFPISVGEYKTMLKELHQGSLETAKREYNKPLNELFVQASFLEEGE